VGGAKVTLPWRFVVTRALSIGRSVVASKPRMRCTRAVSRPETSAVDLRRSSPFVQLEYSLHSSLVAVLVFSRISPKRAISRFYPLRVLCFREARWRFAVWFEL
jgi:hypothetical protein